MVIKWTEEDYGECLKGLVNKISIETEKLVEEIIYQTSINTSLENNDEESFILLTQKEKTK